MLKIRLKIAGKKSKVIYQIVVADARSPRDGRFIEKIGYYNPNSKELVINHQSKEEWLKKGAKPTQTVKNLFNKASHENELDAKEHKKTTKVVTKPTN